MRVSLHHKEEIAHHITTFWFEPEHPVRYEAGQFIELTINHDNPDNRGVRRWFTLSSSPTDQLLSITTKHANKPSSFKKRLFDLNPGDAIQMSDTMGDFVLPKDAHTPLIFVAGGIGITPVHSMIKYLSDTHHRRTTHLLYAAHDTSEIAFKELLDAAVTKTDYITDRSPTTEDILAITQEYTNPLIYLSGPEEMVEVFVAELKENGVSGSRLVTDYFPGYAGIL